MKADIFISKTSNLFTENRLLKFCVVVLAVSTIICMLLANRALDYHRTIIIPPKLDQKIIVTGTSINDEALKMYTRYITNLFLNYTPDTVKVNFQELIELTAPEYYTTFNKHLNEMSDKISTMSASSSFYLSQIKINEEKQFIEVTGLRRFFSESSVVEEKMTTYKIGYRLINGRFHINEFTEK